MISGSAAEFLYICKMQAHVIHLWHCAYLCAYLLNFKVLINKWIISNLDWLTRNKEINKDQQWRNSSTIVYALDIRIFHLIHVETQAGLILEQVKSFHKISSPVLLSIKCSFVLCYTSFMYDWFIHKVAKDQVNYFY